ncbi:hypothetical protein HK098_001082 [Nowakowskiella sp. JEL0407]|nr:hypothetical protein HK098_001082 [Nowakowskiella sp. JEL0407]
MISRQAFIVSVLVPIIIIIKKEEQRPICTDEESAEAHADEDSHPTDEATSLIPHADHETPTPSSSRPVDSTGIAPSSGGVMFANPTYYSVASGSGTGT